MNNKTRQFAFDIINLIMETTANPITGIIDNNTDYIKKSRILQKNHIATRYMNLDDDLAGMFLIDPDTQQATMVLPDYKPSIPAKDYYWNAFLLGALLYMECVYVPNNGPLTYGCRVYRDELTKLNDTGSPYLNEAKEFGQFFADHLTCSQTNTIDIANTLLKDKRDFVKAIDDNSLAHAESMMRMYMAAGEPKIGLKLLSKIELHKFKKQLKQTNK